MEPRCSCQAESDRPSQFRRPKCSPQWLCPSSSRMGRPWYGLVEHADLSVIGRCGSHQVGPVVSDPTGKHLRQIRKRGYDRRTQVDPSSLQQMNALPVVVHIFPEGINGLRWGRSMGAVVCSPEIQAGSPVPSWSREGSRQALRIRAASRRANRSLGAADGDRRRLLRYLCSTAPAPP